MNIFDNYDHAKQYPYHIRKQFRVMNTEGTASRNVADALQLLKLEYQAPGWVSPLPCAFHFIVPSLKLGIRFSARSAAPGLVEQWRRDTEKVKWHFAVLEYNTVAVMDPRTIANHVQQFIQKKGIKCDITPSSSQGRKRKSTSGSSSSRASTSATGGTSTRRR